MGVASTEDPAARATGAGTCLLAGVALGLACFAVPAVVLRPTLDRAAPAHVVAATLGLLVAAGAWLGRADAGRRGAVLAAGLTTGLGGALLYALAPVLNPVLAALLRQGVGPLYHPIVALATAIAGGTLLVPLGMVLAAVLGGGGRREPALVLLALGTSFLSAPYLGDALLGARTLVAAGAVLGLAAAVQMVSGPERAPRERTLAPGAALALPVLGLTLATGVRQLHVHTEAGVLAAPWTIGVAALTAGAALALVDRVLGGMPRAPTSVVVALAVAAVALAFPQRVPIRGLVSRDTLASALECAGVGAPVGLGLALVLAGRGGLSVALAPGLALLAVPLAPLALVPRLGPHALLGTLAVAALALALPGRRARAGAAAAVLALGLMLGPRLVPEREAPGGPGALPAITTERQTQDGHLAYVHDPLTGRRPLAVDGRAALGRTAAHERRLVHVPLLLGPPPETMLLVATGGGAWVDAALAHDPGRLAWLTPFPPALAPTVERLDALVRSDPPILHPHAGSERLFLSGRPTRFDAIVLAPDPRVATRGHLVSTVEFYRQVRERLDEDGVFCQWWDLGATDVSDLKRVIASLHVAFEHPYLLLDHPRSRQPVVGLVGRRRPIRVAPRLLDERIDTMPEVAADLDAIGIDGLIVACLVSADAGVLEILAPREGRLRDARPSLAVRTALTGQRQPRALADVMTTFAARRRSPTPWLDTSHEEHIDLVRLPLTLRQLDRAWMHLVGGAQAVVRQGSPLGVPPFDGEPGSALTDVEADKLIQALHCRYMHPTLVPLVAAYARALLERDGVHAAERYLRRAIEQAETSGRLFYQLARVVERRGDEEDAVRLYRSALWFDPFLDEARDALVLAGVDPDEEDERTEDEPRDPAPEGPGDAPPREDPGTEPLAEPDGDTGR